MTLLLWDTISPIWRTSGKRRTRKASRATALTLTTSGAGKQQAQQRLSRSELRREDSECGDVYKALAASGIFSRTNTETVSAWAKQLVPALFAPGRIVGAQRGRGDGLFVIISGKVKVSYRLPDGSEIILTILGSAEIFGATALFDPESREITVTTLTEVVAVPIEREKLLVWMAERPEVRDQVLRLFARWVSATTNSLADFAFVDAHRRVASRLLFLRQRFGRREGDVVRVVHDLTLKDFARLVGDAPKTIVAVLHDFENREWIRLEGNSVVIVDGHALASLSPMSMSEVPCA
jgi:CRP/FNR family transcriptional regulator, cyclic AMP receptor protein